MGPHEGPSFLTSIQQLPQLPLQNKPCQFCRIPSPAAQARDTCRTHPGPLFSAASLSSCPLSQLQPCVYASPDIPSNHIHVEATSEPPGCLSHTWMMLCLAPNSCTDLGRRIPAPTICPGTCRLHPSCHPRALHPCLAWCPPLLPRGGPVAPLCGWGLACMAKVTCPHLVSHLRSHPALRGPKSPTCCDSKGHTPCAPP